MTGLMILLGIAILALAAAIGGILWIHRTQLDDLLDRLASKSIDEYKYWAKTHPVELEHNKAALDAQLEDLKKKLEPSPAEVFSREKAKTA